MDVDGKLREAKLIMVHYHKLAIEAAGGRWSLEYSAEIEAAVDLIFEAAVEKATVDALLLSAEAWDKATANVKVGK